MKMKKRFLSILLSLSLVLGLMPGMSLTAYADDTKVGTATYTISDGVLTVGSGTFTAAEFSLAFSSQKANIRRVSFEQGATMRTTKSNTKAEKIFAEWPVLESVDMTNLTANGITSIYRMFYKCTALKSVSFGASFDTSKVTTMSEVFSDCKSLVTLDISHFNTTAVTSMFGMFRNCSAFTSLDLSSFNTAKVTDMGSMFYYCSKLRTIYVSDSWNTGAVTSSSNMFYQATSLKGGSGTTYSTVLSTQDKSRAHVDGGQSNPGYLTLKGHMHSFSYNLSNDKTTITATCNGDGECDLSDNRKVSIKITAPKTLTTFASGTSGSLAILNRDLYRAPIEGATAFNEATNHEVRDTWKDNTNNTDTRIYVQYYKIENSNETLLGTEPPCKEAGNYRAKITVENLTAYVDYTLIKQPQTITADDVTVTYGDTDKKVSASVTEPTEGGGAISYSVKSGDAVTVDENTGALTIVKAGSAVITVTAAETATYAQATKDVNVTVNTKAMTVSAENVNVTVDGQPHGITVNVTDPASGATVKYGTEVGTYNLDASPTQTEAGELTVYYQVTADNYTTYTGSAKVTVSAKSTQTINASDVTATYGDTDKKVEATTDGNGAISYAVKDGSADYIDVDASTGALTIKKVGTATVVVTAAETATYAQATKEVTVTINKANAVVATVTANNRTYDGTEKPLVTVTGKATGGTMWYALGENATTAPNESLYTTDIPAKTDAGTYYVWYRVDADKNHNDCGPYPVTVAILSAKMEPKAPTGNELVYNGQEQPLVKAGEVKGGTLVYAIGQDGKTAPGKADFKETLPARKDAGTYYVWYMVKGDKNHNDTEPVALEAEIAKKSLVLSAEDKSKTYGDADPELTWTQEGLVEGDPMTVVLKREAGENLGGHIITVDRLEVSDNYTKGFNEAVLTINAREATVTAVDQTLTEGESIKTDVSMATLSGGAKGDRLVAVTLAASAVNAFEAYGTITPSGAKIVNAAGENVTGNYSLTYAAGKLTVNPYPIPEPDFTLLARMTVSGSSKTALRIAWTKVADADGYDVYFVKCGRSYKSKPKATVTGCSVRVSKLKERTEYKAYVRAWARVGGRKVYLGDSPEVHAITGGYDAKRCNIKSITLNKTKLNLKVGRSATLKATVKGVKSGKKLLSHARKVRYYSSNVNMATVSRNGKVRATGRGVCTIYAIANNGVRTSVKVTVK